jgi:hypothetical protein
MRYSGLAATVTVIAAAGALAGCASLPTVSTTPASNSPSSGASGGTSAKAAAKTEARVGSTIDLTGYSSGEKMAVRVVRVLMHARGTQFTTPGAGHRLMAVQFRLTDIGTGAYSDAPDNSAAVVDSQGQSYQADIGTVAGCQSFGGTENIAVGDSGLGCVVFAVPKHAKITTVQFTLDSGMASDTGQWSASR